MSGVAFLPVNRMIGAVSLFDNKQSSGVPGRSLRFAWRCWWRMTPDCARYVVPNHLALPRYLRVSMVGFRS